MNMWKLNPRPMIDITIDIEVQYCQGSTVVGCIYMWLGNDTIINWATVGGDIKTYLIWVKNLTCIYRW